MFSRETLDKYIQDGLIYERKHPSLDIFIYNYTQRVQYERLWDDVTMSCRGLILDAEQNVIARPFKKFFNIEENMFTPTKKFEVFEKMDGLEFQEFYDRCTTFACKYILHGLTKEQIEQELIDFI